MKTQDIKTELLNTIFAQKKIIIVALLIIFGFSILIALYWPPTYSATASVLVREKNVQKNPVALEGIQQQIDQFRLSKEDLASEIETLTSFEVIERTLRVLEEKNFFEASDEIRFDLLETLGTFIPRPAEKHKLSRDHKRFYKIKSSLSTMVIPASNVIEITLLHKNPEKAVLILNELLNQYLIYHSDIHNPAKEKFFSEHAEQFRRELDQKNKELFELIKKNKISDPKKEMDNLLGLKNMLEQQLYLLKNEKYDKEALITNINNALRTDRMQFFSFLNELDTLRHLALKLQELYIERGSILRKFHEESPKIAVIDRQINDTYKKLKMEVFQYMNTLKKQIDVLVLKIADIENRLPRIDQQNIKLQKHYIDLNQINHEINMLQLSFETFSKRKEEKRINETASKVFLPVTVLSKAFPSNGPLFPDKKMVLPFGLLAGLITGISLAFIAEYFNNTFRTPEDVETITGLPVLFTIKKWG